MSSVRPDSTVRTYLLIAVALLAAGGLLQFGFIRPSEAEIRRLGAARADAKKRLGQQASLEEEAQRLAQSLGVTDISAGMTELTSSDPITFLSGMISDCRLTRLELATHASSDVGRLHRTKFSLRVLGSYSRIVQLVRSMEQNPRLVTVDALSLQPAVEAAGLEGRLDVSIYDPIPEKRP